MATIELTKENFNDTAENNEIVMVDFWAPWCGPCRNFGPIYEEVSEKYEDIVFGKINTEEQQELAGHFQIRSIPTLMIMREKVIVFSQPGMLPVNALDEVIQRARDLDMAKVHLQVSQQAGAA